MKTKLLTLVLTLAAALIVPAKATTLGAIVTSRGVAIAIDSRETNAVGTVVTDLGNKLDVIDGTAVACAGVVSWAKGGDVFSVARQAFVGKDTFPERVKAFKTLVTQAMSTSAACLSEGDPCYKQYLAGAPLLYVVMAGTNDNETVLSLIVVKLIKGQGDSVSLACTSRTITKDDNHGNGGSIMLGTDHARSILDKEGDFWLHYGMLDGVIHFVRQGLSGNDGMSGGTIDSLVMTNRGYRFISRKGREGRFTEVAAR